VEETLITSSVPAGTPLKGINYLSNKEDPVALAESEYPSWLFCAKDPILSQSGHVSSFQTEESKQSLEYLKAVRQDKIKTNNFLKSKKR
jgi:large subunit ribosomal protein L54